LNALAAPQSLMVLPMNTSSSAVVMPGATNPAAARRTLAAIFPDCRIRSISSGDLIDCKRLVLIPG
jgi:hypothetical protein